MTTDNEARWKRRVEAAKRDILERDADAVPDTIKNIALSQITGAIETMENILVCRSPVSFYRDGIVDLFRQVHDTNTQEPFLLMQEYTGSFFLRESCERFFERYGPLVRSEGIEIPPHLIRTLSPA